MTRHSLCVDSRGPAGVLRRAVPGVFDDASVTVRRERPVPAGDPSEVRPFSWQLWNPPVREQRLGGCPTGASRLQLGNLAPNCVALVLVSGMSGRLEAVGRERRYTDGGHHLVGEGAPFGVTQREQEADEAEHQCAQRVEEQPQDRAPETD